MKVACRKCKRIVDGKQAKGITGNNKIVCSVCGSESVKFVSVN